MRQPRTISAAVGRVVLAAALLFSALLPAPLASAAPAAPERTDSPAAADAPQADWLRVLSLRDHNTRVVLFGTAALGLAAGLVGSVTLLRRQALLGDAISHAMLPGIAGAFLLATAWGLPAKSLGLLLAGAAASGILGGLAVLAIRRTTRLKDDAAMGIVLSVFFGAGVALLGLVQQLPAGSAAGLESFIYGKTASMVAADAWRIAAAGLAAATACVLLFKELRLLCFDPDFAGARGYPVVALDAALLGLVVVVTLIGLQAVGLILVIALLVIPAAAARFWTLRMNRLAGLAAGFGALSGLVGAAVSAAFPRLPSGAMIVLAATALFSVSLLFGPAQGILIRRLRRRAVNQRILRDHLLRALFEQLELRLGSGLTGPACRTVAVPISQLIEMRSWSARVLHHVIRRAERRGWVAPSPDGGWTLSGSGFELAARRVHEHRLWELYLMTHAEVVPQEVDREADTIEHVLEPAMIAELEALLDRRLGDPSPVPSPHPVAPGGGASGAAEASR